MEVRFDRMILKKTVVPAKAADPDQLRRLIADLSSPRFPVRERASKELGSLGGLTESALAANPNAEAKGRLEKLLAPIDGQEYDAEALSVLRAMRVLKDIDTPAARELLEAFTR